MKCPFCDSYIDTLLEQKIRDLRKDYSNPALYGPEQEKISAQIRALEDILE